MTDEAAKAHPEMNLRCADCGHTWQARVAIYCPRCASGEVLVRQANWTPPAPAPAA